MNFEWLVTAPLSVSFCWHCPINLDPNPRETLGTRLFRFWLHTLHLPYMKGVFILTTLSWHAGCTHHSLFPSSYVKLLDMGSNFRQCEGFNSPDKKTPCQGHSIMGMYFNSINPFFLLFFNGNFWKHSASVKFKSRLWLSLLYVVLWEQSKKYIDRILDFMQFVVPFWHALLTRRRWRYSLGCATHQLTSSRRPVSKGATRKTAKLTERLE